MRLIHFNDKRDTIYAHRHELLDNVLHIVHENWHGIRSATAACPGMKVTIPHDKELDGEALRHLIGIIYKYGIKKIIFQGYSNVAHEIAKVLFLDFGNAIDLYVITHVNSSQFEYQFEIDMQEKILDQFRHGVFRRLGSVKPDFNHVIAEYWPETIINYAPNLRSIPSCVEFETNSVFIPLENTWRKNLYTNILAAASVPDIHTIYTVNWPTGLEKIAPLSHVRLLGYLRGIELYSMMASVNVVLAATLAECQPMTQLEAFAVGTPSLTGPLCVKELADHEVTRLSEVSVLDNPFYIKQALTRLMEAHRSDPNGMQQMLKDYLRLRHEMAHRHYIDFLEL